MSEAPQTYSDLLEACRERGWTLATAESLTAGLVSSRLCDVAGASAVVRGAIVAYATEVKASLLDVDQERLSGFGPVDPVVAEQMALGACAKLGADVGLATTGVAGPGPADGHEAGTVYVAVVTPGGGATRRLALTGERNAVRAAAAEAVVALAYEIVSASA